MMTIIHGLSMALADSVPGVSGGTVAFIMGFYERLLNALHLCFGKDKEGRKRAFRYLMKFGAGWGLGMGVCVLLLSRVFEKYIYFLSSLFLGLTVAAVPVILHEERDVIKGRRKNLAFTFLGAAAAVSLTALRTCCAPLGAPDFERLTILQYGTLFLSGALAASAMLLPGISGSTLLLILGIYVPAIAAAREVLHGHWPYLPGILSMAAGVLCGIVCASKLIRKALLRYRSQTVYLIVGLMLGSMDAIRMGPTTLHTPKPPLDLSTFHMAAFFTGVAVLACLESVKRRTACRAAKSAQRCA